MDVQIRFTSYMYTSTALTRHPKCPGLCGKTPEIVFSLHKRPRWETTKLKLLIGWGIEPVTCTSHVGVANQQTRWNLLSYIYIFTRFLYSRLNNVNKLIYSIKNSAGSIIWTCTLILYSGHKYHSNQEHVILQRINFSLYNTMRSCGVKWTIFNISVFSSFCKTM